MTNRLATAASPYLLQHATNPVDWWPWSPEAFEEARRRDVPVLVSIGYAACHWCHVMAHESFEDETVARQVNEHFVAIKVDREERPDVDAVYMAATQAMTGQGGWPMTVFATPEGEPFFCGTYFPPASFTRLLDSIAEAWRTQRAAVLKQSSTVVEAIGGAQLVGGPTAPISADLLDAAAAQLAKDHDTQYGGFGGAPKFPPHMNLLFLLRRHQRTGSAEDLEMVRHTAEQMARGGIYDQIGGGFARYAVDNTWTVPHFEKMLYDNALLLRVYTQLWRLTEDPLARRIADETATFLLRDLATSAGGLASALDADTEGTEGLTYSWTPAQLIEALGEDDGTWAADLFAVTTKGTFEHGTSVLALARDIDAADPALVARWQKIRSSLHSVRAKRPQPARDDKVVASWNGLAITALAEHAILLNSPSSRQAAIALADVLATRHLVDGRLRRVSRGGVVGEPAGVLEDYGAVAEAFCAVHQLTGDGRWLSLAGDLLQVALDHFGTGNGGFYDTADDAERLVTRPADPTDNATPSGLSAMCAGLVAYAALSGETRFREAADAALATVGPLIGGHPRFTGYSATVAEAALAGPFEIAIVTENPEEPLVGAAYRHAPPGTVIVVGRPDQDDVPLLADRPFIEGAAAAYVCRGFVCDRPVTTVDDLEARLAR
ncbi:thioredoxin domain-containing protein [Actinoplanes sp. TFC3]|uniref:thioredoxin domain-containing protein n=1 Tax=Actinoplanes sp. TFC3 TaxID=1710355 RepID=UPI000829A7FB|nr:thioredoxin domain-containing protein [Actinoplanes sp. TFC3]